MDKPEIHKVLDAIINECQAPGQSIMIRPLTRGYHVEIGCASFAFERLGDMIEAVNLFLDDPQDARTIYNEHMSDLVGVTTPPPQAAHCDGEMVGLRDLRAGATRVGYPDEERS